MASERFRLEFSIFSKAGEQLNPQADVLPPEAQAASYTHVHVQASDVLDSVKEHGHIADKKSRVIMLVERVHTLRGVVLGCTGLNFCCVRCFFSE